MDSDDSGDSLAQILLLQQALQDLQLELESSIAELDSRLNMTDNKRFLISRFPRCTTIQFQ